ncbi:MAG: SRPBCC family protein [Cyanobacteria bacterium J06639_1]
MFGNDAFEAIARRQALKVGTGVAISLLALGAKPAAALFDSPLENLPVQARVAVREGAAYVAREGDTFRGYVLVDAPTESVWDVLTDYEQFPQFLPNTEDYTVLSEALDASDEEAGRTLQVESITSAQVLLLRVRSRDRFDIVEQPFNRIEFELVSSETLRDMAGAWSLQTIERAGSEPQVLVAYEAAATPNNQFSAGAFASIFQTQLESTLAAIRDEVVRRGS